MLGFDAAKQPEIQEVVKKTFNQVYSEGFEKNRIEAVMHQVCLIQFKSRIIIF
jgi:hypothetical protein